MVEVYIDDNRSAYKRNVSRENFERMLADVRAGRIDAIVTWQADRLLRTVEDASAIVTIAKSFGTVIANVQGTIDLSTASGLRASTWPWPPSTRRPALGATAVEACRAGRGGQVGRGDAELRL